QHRRQEQTQVEAVSSQPVLPRTHRLAQESLERAAAFDSALPIGPNTASGEQARHVAPAPGFGIVAPEMLELPDLAQRAQILQPRRELGLAIADRRRRETRCTRTAGEHSGPCRQQDRTAAELPASHCVHRPSPTGAGPFSAAACDPAYPARCAAAICMAPKCRSGKQSLPDRASAPVMRGRSEEHTSELQSREKLVCRLLL